MATYHEWNQAILRYYLDTVPYGAPGYLSIDNESFTTIAQHLGQAENSGLDDFLAAIRTRCVYAGRVQVGNLRHPDAEGRPQGAAFLAGMVLAASRMGEDERTNSNAYYSRLREILGLTTEVGRPLGLTRNDETLLWERWNAWTRSCGFIPTAKRGIARQDRFRGYAIGQSLLRDVDKQALRRAFARFKFGTLLDEEEALWRVRKNAGALTVHLREIIGDDRADAASDHIFEVYEEWNEARIQRQHRAGEAEHNSTSKGWHPFELGSKTLFCGLLRREKSFTGEPSFYLLPRFRVRHGANTGCIKVSDTWRPLLPLDSRWWKPVGPVNENAVTEGHTFEVSGHNDEPHVYAQATLPQRDFWILVPDELYGSDDFGSWRAPKLGESIVLLAKRYLFPQLLPLRGKVLDWEGTPQPLEDSPDWAELYDLRIVASDWSGVTLPNLSLLEALKPRQYLSLSLSGGVRVPLSPGSWLEGYGPQLTIHVVPSEDNDEVQITLLSPSTCRSTLSVPPNQPISLPYNEKGVWLIEALYEGREATTLLRIANWEGLSLPQQYPEYWCHAGELRWCGAVLARRPPLMYQ